MAALRPDRSGLAGTHDPANPAHRSTLWQRVRDALSRASESGPSPTECAEVAQAFAHLGLREPSAIWARGIGRDPRLSPVLVSLAQQLERMPSSVVEPADRIEAASLMLDTQQSLRAQLRPFFDTWAVTQRSLAWFRAADGHTIALASGSDPLQPGAWHRLVDVLASAAQVQLPSNDPSRGGVPPPVLLDGFATPWLLLRAIRELPPLTVGSRATLHVIEERAGAALDGLADLGLAQHLKGTDATPSALDRVRWWLGPEAHTRAITHLSSRLGAWSSLRYATDQRDRPTPAFRDALGKLLPAQMAAFERTKRSNDAVYRDRDAAWWVRRFEQAGSGGEPLRVLVPTTRFSTYIQNASRDIVSAFQSQGLDAELLIEPDAGSETNALAIAEAVERVQPDFIVLINYTRRQYGSVIPAEVPFITWVQDALPGLFTAESAAAVSPVDAVVGSVYTTMVTEHGYNADSCLRFPVPASESKFAAPARSSDRRSFDCDLLIAMNHAETPADMARRLERDAVESQIPAGLTARVCAAAEQAAADWHSGWLAWLLEDAVHPVLEEWGLSPEAPLALDLIRSVAQPMVNRVLRHRLVGWAVDLAERDGLRLRLCGRDWESHPRFGKYAAGPLEHGAALREAYRGAIVTLHTGAGWFMHQRLYECALAGGLPAVMLKPEDAALALRPARELARRKASPTVSRLDDRLACVRATDHPVYARSLALAQRMRSPGDSMVPGRRDDCAAALADGLIPVGSGRGGMQPEIRELISPETDLRLIEAFSIASFDSPDQLAAVVTKAAEDAVWRESQIEMLHGLARDCCTYEHATAGILRFLSGRLKRAVAGEQSGEDQGTPPKASPATSAAGAA